MRVLVTRPEPEASATAARLKALGHEPIVDPLLIPEQLPAALPDPRRIAAIALTSRAGARALGHTAGAATLREKPVYTVGDATAAAAREAGFTSVVSGGGTVTDLAETLAGSIDPATGVVLHATAPDRSGDLAAELAPIGIAVETIAIYRMAPSPGLARATLEAIADGTVEAVLLFSRRTAEIYVSHMTEARISADWLDIPVHAISPTVAARVAEAGARTVRIAAEPTAEALFATLR